MNKSIEKLRKHGLENSHWGLRCIKALDNEFTDEDLFDSKDWFSCACGKLDTPIERYFEGVPVDKKLRSLGNDFLICVSCDDVIGAIDTLVRIHRRAEKLQPKESPFWAFLGKIYPRKNTPNIGIQPSERISPWL